MAWGWYLIYQVPIILGTVEMLYRIGSMDADWAIRLRPVQRYMAAALCVAQAADIAWRQRMLTAAARSMLCMFAGCLFAACVMDLWEHAVYRFVWWAAGGIAGLLLLWRTGICAGKPDIGGLLFYILIQQCLFGRMYGRADCHAFCVCAVMQAVMGGELQDYLVHMAAAFLMLALFQGIRRNIAVTGNLKKPVPFLPYITVSFWLWVDFMAGKWYI